MKPIHLVVAVALLLSVSIGVAVAADPAPNFSLKTFDGKTIELKKLQGKVVIVNFWATWCPPCRQEIPGMTRVYDEVQEQRAGDRRHCAGQRRVG